MRVALCLIRFITYITLKLSQRILQADEPLRVLRSCFLICAWHLAISKNIHTVTHLFFFSFCCHLTFCQVFLVCMEVPLNATEEHVAISVMSQHLIMKDLVKVICRCSEMALEGAKSASGLL